MHIMRQMKRAIPRLRGHQPSPCGDLVQDLLPCGVRVRLEAHKGEAPAQHRVQDHPQRPHVAAAIARGHRYVRHENKASAGAGTLQWAERSNYSHARSEQSRLIVDSHTGRSASRRGSTPLVDSRRALRRVLAVRDNLRRRVCQACRCHVCLSIAATHSIPAIYHKWKCAAAVSSDSSAEYQAKRCKARAADYPNNASPNFKHCSRQNTPGVRRLQ